MTRLAQDLICRWLQVRQAFLVQAGCTSNRDQVFSTCLEIKATLVSCGSKGRAALVHQTMSTSVTAIIIGH